MIRHTLISDTPRKTFRSDNYTRRQTPTFKYVLIIFCIPGSGRCGPEHNQAPAPLKLALLEDPAFRLHPILSQGCGGSSVWP